MTNNNFFFRIQLTCLLLLLTPWLSARAEELVPEDRCVVELTLPEGSTVAIDNVERGTQRTFEFEPLQPKTIYSYDFVISYPSGKTSEHTILVEGGRRIRLTKLDPDSSKPELIQAAGLPPIACHQFTPDMRLMALGHQNGTISIWDTKQKRLLRHFSEELAM